MPTAARWRFVDDDPVTLLELGLVDSANDGVVSLEGLQSQLLLGLEAGLLHLLNLSREDLGSGGSGVDAVSLDGDDEAAALLEEILSIEGEDTALIGLSDVHKDAVNKTGDEHAVLHGVAGIIENGNNVGAALGHLLEVTARAVRELDSVDDSLGTDEIGNVANSGSRGCAKVKNRSAGLHTDALNTIVNSGGKLGAVGVPHTELDGLSGTGDSSADALLAIDGNSGDHGFGGEGVGLALDDVNALEALVRLDNVGLLCAGGGTTASSSTSSSASSATSSTAASATSSSETAASASTTATTSKSTTTAHIYVFTFYLQ